MEDASRGRREALLGEYAEVSSTFRLLTDIRFKLLAFLPIASGAAAVVLKDQSLTEGLLFSLFGLAATTGLAIYNARNDQLYDELVARAAVIERLLELPDGAFANRPRPWLTIRLLGVPCNVDHRTGVATIYAASIALWLFGIYAPVLELLRVHLDLPSMPENSVPDVTIWIQFAALVLSVLSTLVAWAYLKRQEQERQRSMRQLASAAVEELITLGPTRAAEDARFIARCAELARLDIHTVRSRAIYYAGLNECDQRYYMLTQPKLLAMSHFLALLTDLPPRWIHDCVTNRRGAVMSQITR